MSVALVTAYTTAYNRLRLLAGTQIGQVWDSVAGLDDAALDLFLRRALPLMAGAEAAQARLTIGYLTALRRQTLGTAPAVNIDVRDIIGTNLRGVDPTEVFSRPTITARTAISQGKDFLDAVGLARQRATELAETNVMLTQRATVAHMGGTDTRVVGYRRVLTGESCELCATVSTQRYHTGQLHPIHSHCDCGVAEIYGHADPGQVINSKLLGELKARNTAEGVVRSDALVAAQKNASKANSRIRDIRSELATETNPKRRSQLEGQLTGWQDRKTAADESVASHRTKPPDEVAIHIHGELGPLLTVKGQHFDGPFVAN